MSAIQHPTPNPDEPAGYQIRIRGHLGHQWADWFEDLAIIHEDNGDTLLASPDADQAALHGILKKVRDLGIPLISVNRVEPGALCRIPKKHVEGDR